MILALGDKDLALRSLRSIKNYFAVVGIMEQLKPTLALLEWTFPSYFKGSIELFESIRPEKVTTYDKPGSDVKARLASLFAADTEIFRFLRGRFQAQLAACGIPMS